MFFLTFSIEVRVKAEVVQLSDAVSPVQEPRGCLDEGSVCAVRTRDGEKFVLTAGTSELTLDQSSTVVRLSPTEARLVWGSAWVRAKGGFTVRSEFGDAKIQGGEFWITKTEERIIVSAISADVEVSPRGSSEKVLVEPGEENWVSRVDASGSAQVGVPRAISFPEHVARWARLYSGGKKSFAKAVKEFHAAWLKASERSANLHKELMARKIASVEEEKSRRETARRRQAEEERKLREMFRRKVLGDE